jgi:hypothetical protein
MERPNVRGYRIGMWLLFLVGLLNLIVSIRGLRSERAAGSGSVGLFIFFLCVGLGGWLGLLGARRISRGRDQQSRTDAILLLVSELGRHDDDTLQRIARQGGPAGEAAVMVLQGRRERSMKG